MSEATADIIGTKGANFTFTVSSGTVTSAIHKVPNKPDNPLKVEPTGREITVPDLPVGDSSVRLDIVWAPADPDAVIDVGTVISGTVNAADPKHTLDAGDTPGYVHLFGK